ncbi:MAG: 3-isopropylmalate dehydratase [Candidatus Omnitrophica bacterium]|nr:3-isopropylmalate dehydratase [Candidatus Omnitrophota bacterium]MCM8799856.1 3-isopropylmalate dehydratase [Candidatus Omnitrophota bacterium]
MIIEGKAIKLKDNINTDLIISGRYKFSIVDLKELTKHIMEDLDPQFSKKIIPGATIIVAGKNFGLGSSREQAPLVIKEAGILAVVAKSFARIFYRNAFNIGLPLVELNTDFIQDGDFLKIDLKRGIIEDLTKDLKLDIKPLPKFMLEFLQSSGVINYIKKNKKLKL